MKNIRVILIDDHAIVRRGLAALLHADDRYRVVAEANDGEEALERLDTVEVDIAILDLSMPRLNGLETLRRIAKLHPKTRTIVLSMYDDEQFVAQSLRDGAYGYILKQAMDDELFGALDRVMQGGRFISPAIDMERIEHRHLERIDLTDREREVLQLIVDGHTTQAVAETLSISPHTATRHRANLMQKLRVHTQMELVRAAAQRGLVVLPKPPLDI
ncbi:MAG TPA: response regulator transcription factor [Edaphobacter sp.]